MTKPDTTPNLVELMNSQDDFPLHPRAAIDYDNLTLTLDAAEPYEIDLEKWTSSAEVLDTILQVAGKPWPDGDLLRQLLDAIEEVFAAWFKTSAQGAICPFGQEMRLDWRRRTYRPAKGGQGAIQPSVGSPGSSRSGPSW